MLLQQHHSKAPVKQFHFQIQLQTNSTTDNKYKKFNNVLKN